MKTNFFRFSDKQIEKDNIIQAFIISGSFFGGCDTLIRLKYTKNGQQKIINKFFDNEAKAEKHLEKLRNELGFIYLSHHEIYNPDHYLGLQTHIDEFDNYIVTIQMKTEIKVEYFLSLEAALEFYAGLPDNLEDQYPLPSLRR